MKTEHTLQMVEVLKETAGDLEWLRKNYKNVMSQYSGLFIAVKSGQVVVYGASKEEILSKLMNRKIDVSDVLIEYIPSKNELIIV